LISHIKEKVETKTVSEQGAVENTRTYNEVTRGSKKQYNEDWYCSPTNNMTAGHMKHMINMKNAYKFPVDKTEGKIRNVSI
jgi:hypothetical protein